MATFSDNFNRADGPLGDDWTLLAGSYTIESQHAVGGVGGCALVAAPIGTGRHRAVATIFCSTKAGVGVELIIKSDATVSNYYTAMLGEYQATRYVVIGRRIAPVYVELLSQTIAPASGGTAELAFEWDAGVLTVTLDGGVIATVNDNNLSGLSYAAIRSNRGDTWLDDYSLTSDPARTMTITPDPLWVGGGPCLITATGTGTEWADGDDPSTVFSADHGTVEIFRFVSATEWELVYTPTEYIGTITFSETQYGLEDTVNGVLTPPTEGGNGICQLTPAGAELVNSSTPGDDRKLVTDHTLVVAGFEQLPQLPYLDAISDIWYATHSDLNLPGGVETVVEGITKLWQAINGITDIGGGPWDPSYGEPLGATIAKLRDSWLIGAGPDCYSVQDIIDAVGGGGGGLEQHIRDDIGIENNGTWTSLLQVLLGLWGPGADTITTLGTRFDELVTISGWNLGNVKTWIEAIPPTDLIPVTHKLDHIQPDEGDTLSTIQTQADAIKLVVDQTQTSLGAYRTGSNYTVQDILDAIDGLSAKIEALPTTSAPVWPGLANVTLGTPVAYSDNLSIVAPMDGVIVAWTSPPSKTGHYVLGNEHYYYGSGRIAFGTDSGDLEPPQWLGFTSAIYTPQNMQRASAVRFQGVGGAVGTVTPWTRS